MRQHFENRFDDTNFFGQWSIHDKNLRNRLSQFLWNPHGLKDRLTILYFEHIGHRQFLEMRPFFSDKLPIFFNVYFDECVQCETEQY